MTPKRYSKENIMTILTILQANDFSINKTSAETKIHRATITNWLKKYGDEIGQKPPVVPAVIQARVPEKEPELDVVEEKTMIKYQDELLLARIEMLRQLRKVIPTCYNVRTAAEAMKIMTDINADIINSQTEKPPEINVFQNIMNNIENLQLNIKKKKE